MKPSGLTTGQKWSPHVNQRQPQSSQGNRAEHAPRAATSGDSLSCGTVLSHPLLLPVTAVKPHPRTGTGTLKIRTDFLRRAP